MKQIVPCLLLHGVAFVGVQVAQLRSGASVEGFDRAVA
jgi:hypothetical protein